MCCIFTCCGWMIDLIQRLWTFAMSCCISSAVCCSLITAAMSGIALGYNYSLAEYIDLKETNVSIYIKRGVFDDDVAGDLEWRRSGRMPVDGLIGENNLVTAESDDDAKPVQSGRRLDDSILESNDKNSFEGALMKLTAKPPAGSSISIFTREFDVSQIISELPHQPLNHLKAIQSAINMQKAPEAQRRQFETNKITPESSPPSGRRMLPHFSYGYPPFERPSTIYSLRNAVPQQAIDRPEDWLAVKAPQFITTNRFDEYFELPTIPTPVTVRPTPVRPRKPTFTTGKPKPTLTARIPAFDDWSMKKHFKDKSEVSNENLMIEKDEGPSEVIRENVKKDKNQNDEDYEEEVKGIPIRKKRNAILKSDDSNVVVETNKHVPDLVSKLKLSNSVNDESLTDTINYVVRLNTEEYEGALQESKKLLDSTLVKLLITTTSS